jgi:hypothetical protein
VKRWAITLVASFSIGVVWSAQRTVTNAQAQAVRRASVKGHIRIVGKLPGNPVIRMGMDPMCAQLNAGKRPVQEMFAATADGSLANVFVRLQGTLPASPVPSQPVVIDQRGCLYTPRVIGARVGQMLEVRNNDELLHNVHSSSARGNSFNFSEPKAGMVQQFKLKDEEIMLRIGCDVHKWMTAYVGVVNNSYFAVSNTAGMYAIDNVPAGTYSLQAWHEQYGTKSQTVRIAPGSTSAVVEITYP